MQSTLSAFKRPSNGSGENNASSSRMHKERKEKKPWTLLEDLRLRDLVAVYGPRDWKFIGEQMQVKTGRSCRYRWFISLDPRINKNAFNDEEDETLLAAQNELGNKWSSIAKRLPGRTDSAVKNRWHQLMKQKLKKQKADRTRERHNNERTANSLGLFTQHVSISQPSSSSLPPSEDTMETRNVKTNTPKFIDFLGVGDS